MYIYESHMGGLYSSFESLDWDDLYCEQCGDSDWEIGNFETAEEAWEYLKPYDLCCIDCTKVDDFDEDYFCENDCELIDEYNTSNSFGLLYTLSFIAQTFDVENRHVYLICRDKESNRVFVKFKPLGHEFGKYHQLPISFSLNDTLDNKVAISLIPTTCEVVEKPKLLKVIKDNDSESIIYECIVNKSEDDSLDNAYYYDDNWYGWLSVDDFSFLPHEEFLKDVLK